jgi:hypothetical protein
MNQKSISDSILPQVQQPSPWNSLGKLWKEKAYSISSSRRQSVDFQDSIIRWHRLKCNIRMPGVAGEFAWFSQQVYRGRKAFLLLHAADDTDMITELAAGFSDRMNVKAR